jgi:hypothetical protein
LFTPYFKGYFCGHFDFAIIPPPTTIFKYCELFVTLKALAPAYDRLIAVAAKRSG